MEFGARALGNRSILANPCDYKIKEILIYEYFLLCTNYFCPSLSSS